MPSNVELNNRLQQGCRESQRLRREGQLEEALQAAQDIYREASQSTALKVQAECALTLAYVYHDMDDWSSAERFYSEALRVSVTVDDANEAEARIGLGILRLDRGELGEAERMLLAALAAAERGENSKLIGAACSNLGLVYVDLGRLDEALRFHQRGLGVFDAVGSEPGRARQHTNLGLLYERLGEADAAIAHHQQALSIDQRRNDAGQLAVDYGNLGDLYFNYLDDFDGAECCYRECLKYAQQSGSRRGLRSAMNGLGWIALHRDDLPAAREYFLKSLKAYQQIGLKVSEADAHVQLGHVLACSGELAAATGHCQAALEIYDHLGHVEGKMFALLHLGQIALLHEQNPSKAIVELNRAVQLFAELPHPDLQWRVYVELGGAHYQLRDLDRAHDAFLKAEESVQRMQRGMWREHHQIAMFGSKEGLYSTLVLLSLMRWAGEGSRAFIEAWEILERGRSRALLEMLGRTPLATRVEIGCDLVLRERDLLLRLQRLTSDLAAGAGESVVELVQQANATQSELEGVLDEIAEDDAEYVSLRRGQTVMWSELSECLKR